MEIESKVCSVCGKEKPFSEYYKDVRGKFGLYAKCKTCHVAICMEADKANPERRRARGRAWYDRDRVKARETKYKWRAENPESVAATKQRYFAKPDTKAKRAALDKKRQKEFPEKMRTKCKLRTKRIKENGGHFGEKEMLLLLETYGAKCLCCGDVGKIEADHVIPVSKGGSNDMSNRQPLCPKCNLKKASKTIDYRMENKCLQ
jgi:hypothetical protein